MAKAKNVVLNMTSALLSVWGWKNKMPVTGKRMLIAEGILIYPRITVADSPANTKE